MKNPEKPLILQFRDNRNPHPEAIDRRDENSGFDAKFQTANRIAKKILSGLDKGVMEYEASKPQDPDSPSADTLGFRIDVLRIAIGLVEKMRKNINASLINGTTIRFQPILVGYSDVI